MKARNPNAASLFYLGRSFVQSQLKCPAVNFDQQRDLQDNSQKKGGVRGLVVPLRHSVFMKLKGSVCDR